WRIVVLETPTEARGRGDQRENAARRSGQGDVLKERRTPHAPRSDCCPYICDRPGGIDEALRSRGRPVTRRPTVQHEPRCGRLLRLRRAGEPFARGRHRSARELAWSPDLAFQAV